MCEPRSAQQRPHLATLTCGRAFPCHRRCPRSTGNRFAQATDTAVSLHRGHAVTRQCSAPLAIFLTRVPRLPGFSPVSTFSPLGRPVLSVHGHNCSRAPSPAPSPSRRLTPTASVTTRTPNAPHGLHQSAFPGGPLSGHCHLQTRAGPAARPLQSSKAARAAFLKPSGPVGTPCAAGLTPGLCWRHRLRCSEPARSAFLSSLLHPGHPRCHPRRNSASSSGSSRGSARVPQHRRQTGSAWSCRLKGPWRSPQLCCAPELNANHTRHDSRRART